MTDSDSRQLLATHPFAAALGDDALDTLSAMATIVEYEPGDWITRQGSLAHAMHLVVSGRAAIEVCPPGRAPLVIATVHGGEVLGWSWLFPPHAWHFDVVALDPVRSIMLEAAALREACEADHDLGFSIVFGLARVMASRLEATRLRLVDVYGTPD